MYSRIIAHRGIINGLYTYRTENHPEHIQRVLDTTDFDVEIDVWVVDGKYYLGHNEPTYLLSNWELLLNLRVWRHAKNLDALIALSRMSNMPHTKPTGNFFWHDNDAVTMTNGGIIWVHVDTPPFEGTNVVIVKPEHQAGGIDESLVNMNLFGVCTAYPEEYRKLRMEYYA